MTERRRICVIADDLTGAAEIAGVAHRRGLATAIVLDPSHAPGDVEAVVYDTDTRLQTAGAAAARIRLLALGLKIGGNPALLYKKTDSVLRGNVRAEVEALASAFERPRVLLVPANPSGGRTIRDGVYRIHDVPLAETEFARDPHHPARSSLARELLGPGTMALTQATGANALPDDGIVIGDAATAEDVVRWAERVDARTLPAGGREFFTALLAAIVPAVTQTLMTKFSLPALVISGSTADAAREATTAARVSGVPVLPLSTDDSELSSWIESTQRALATRGIAWAVVDRSLDPDPTAAGRFTARFARLAQELFARGGFQHLILEGGATAAAVLHALSIPALNVTGEWASGVVALAGDKLAVTMKPGSYPWPENLTHLLRG